MIFQTCGLLFITGLTSHLAMVHNVYMPPGQKWHCKITCLVNFISYLWSTLLILNMTFDRFYSIIRPHKAASFNTVKRAKITVVCVIIISVLYNSPHFFVASNVNWDCVPYGAALGNVLGEIYYWLSFVVQFALPFVLLLFMNSVIIHKIRTRSAFTHEGVSSGDSSNSGDQLKTKNPESQMFAILLLVTFTFMILTTPSYGFFLYVRIFDFSKTPRRFAGYYMFYNVAHKMQISGHGINFFLYVISGRKFRTDLRKLFSFLNVAKGNKGSVITLSEKVTSSDPSVGWWFPHHALEPIY